MIRWVRWLATARAPGGKAGAASPSVHRDPARLMAFSDGVFAITITLLILEIRLIELRKHPLRRCAANDPAAPVSELTLGAARSAGHATSPPRARCSTSSSCSA